MESVNLIEFKTIYGVLILGEYKNQLCICDWKYRKMRTIIDKRISIGLDAELIINETAFLKDVKNQLQKYFDKQLKVFEIPLLFVGTNFQKSVWQQLLQIPYGISISYKTLSNRINNLEAIRAVASANGANAISIVVPCHRVVGSNGELTGYAGGIETKKKLLLLEGINLNSTQQLLF
jgi:methylated-DNA-[protein]-cysteine S-methyltransferase